MANILVVDDDATIRDVLRKTLSCLDHNVIVASNGKEGFSKAFWRKVDVILLDVVMPGENGLDVLAKLKKAPRTRHIPVLMLTGHDNQEYRTQSSEDYADYYVVKPSSASVISEKIAKIFKNVTVKPGFLARICRW